MTEKEQQILQLLRENPMIPQQTLADKLGCSRSAVAGHIMNLSRKGIIQGKGYIIAPEQYAVVIGGANMDLCGQAHQPLINGDSNPGSLTCSPGGVGRNISENLSRLGSKVQFISAVGDDKWGDQLKQACLTAGVSVDHCLTVTGATSSSYLSLHNPDGEMQVALNDMALIDSLDADYLTQQNGVISRSSLIVLDANLHPDALDYLFHIHHNKPIFVDPVSSVKAVKLTPFLSQIHTLKPNKLEAELLSGQSINRKDDIRKVAETLHNKGIRRLLISLGSEGAYASDHSGGFYVKTSGRQVCNVTGAGDALMAGLAHAYLKNWSWKEGVQFALGAAGLAVNSKHTINSVMSEQSVLRLIKDTTQC